MRQFVDTRLCRQKVGFHDTLKQSQIHSQKSHTIKADINLCQWLHVAKDSGRDVDLNNILRHEPLALADTAGNLCPTNKAALGKILEQRVTAEVIPVSALKTCSITDGQTLVQAIGKPSGAKSFGDLVDALNTSVFSYFNQNCPRSDVVFDRYRKTSIKSGTRSKREGRMRSICRKIDSRDIPLPENWKKFMDLPENKANLT